jgi:hypothetical protein
MERGSSSIVWTQLRRLLRENRIQSSKRSFKVKNTMTDNVEKVTIERHGRSVKISQYEQHKKEMN